MRNVTLALAATALLLGGCGRHGKEVAGDAPIPGAPDCGNKPAFVALHADAKVTVCNVSRDDKAGKDSGTIIYTSAAAPAAVLAAAREQAEKAGLAEQLSTPETYSAAERDRRSVLVMAAPEGGGSQVTLTWSRVR